MKKKEHQDSPIRILKSINVNIFFIGLMLLSISFVNAQNENANENSRVDGGEISTTDMTIICLDGIPDPINVTLIGASGRVKQWIITDDENNILALPDAPPFDLDGASPGVCRIWHLSYNGIKPLDHKHVRNLSDLLGRYDLSNYIEVTRRLKPTGGTLEGGPFEFCVGDGIVDNIPEDSITLSGNNGTNSQWLVTDSDGNILGLPPSPYVVDFDGAGAGTCLIWHLMYEDGLEGAEIGNNTSDLMGCFELSNPISVVRNQPEGGTLIGGPFEFCVGDGIADNIPEDSITLSGNSGTNSQWVVTDSEGNILGLPPSPYAVNFDGAGAGTCFVWHLSFDGDLQGAEVGNNTVDLMGCFSLSNPISVVRDQPDGGILDGGPFTFAVGDGTADSIPDGDITLTEDSGANSQWVVTDTDGNILGLPASPYDVDFDGAGAGTCLIWHLNYDGSVVGLEIDLNIADLEGCYDLSNSISVERSVPNTGRIRFFPNPTRSILNISLKDFDNETFKVSIHNLQNIKLLDKSFDQKASISKSLTLDVGKYMPGLYIVSLTSANGQTFTRRLLIE